MYKVILSSIFIFLSFPQEKNLLAEDILDHLLPAQVDGWKPVAQDETYQADNLHEYINGAAELYISYGFKEMVTRIYEKEGQPDITVDLFDMGSPKNAFGIFSHTRETVNSDVGEGAQYTSGQLLLWKNNYYVSILCYPETEAVKKAVFKLAKIIDRRLPQKSGLPPILSTLPSDSLVEESIRLFHHPAWLNTYYFISEPNVLEINENTDVLLAKYGSGASNRVLLIIQYPDKEKAQKAFNKFTDYYMPALKDSTAVQINYGSWTWTASEVRKKYIVAVFNATSKQGAMSLLNKVLQKLR